MKFLIVGLGSMGKRRVRNLTQLGAGEIIGFDPSAERRTEAEDALGITTYSNVDDAMAQDPDALVISTPPDLHVPYAELAARADKHFFTEASVTDDGIRELIALTRGKNITAAPSCTMRFHPGVTIIKDLIEQGDFGKPLVMTHQCGQYLPDWHPWEDYRDFYVSKKETGACREIVPYELAWLTWLVGDVDCVAGMRAKVTELETDIDDVYQMLMRFKSGVSGHLLIDVVARPHTRHLRLMNEKAQLTWLASETVVRVYDGSRQQWNEYPLPDLEFAKGYVSVPENAYEGEMKAFVDSCLGVTPWHYSYTDDLNTLNVLYAAEASADGGHVTPKTV
jgi:predicted dehydrogenase